MALVEVRAAGPKGRGVFAIRDIEEGEEIERAPVVPLKRETIPAINLTPLACYVFEWGESDWADGEGVAVALGYVSLYNHSYAPNSRYHQDYATNEIYVRALKPIKAGDEVTFNYNGTPDCMDALWFEVQP